MPVESAAECRTGRGGPERDNDCSETNICAESGVIRICWGNCRAGIRRVRIDRFLGPSAERTGIRVLPRRDTEEKNPAFPPGGAGKPDLFETGRRDGSAPAEERENPVPFDMEAGKDRIYGMKVCLFPDFGGSKAAGKLSEYAISCTCRSYARISRLLGSGGVRPRTARGRPSRCGTNGTGLFGS